MSTKLIRLAAMQITCDAPAACGRTFTADVRFTGDGRAVRQLAAAEGWQVRPNRGKGSRSAPDFCPWHAEVSDDVR